MTPAQIATKLAKHKQPAGQMPRHDCHGVHPDQTHEEWLASLKKEAATGEDAIAGGIKPREMSITDIIAGLTGLGAAGALGGAVPGGLIGATVGGARAPEGYLPQSIIRGGIKGTTTGAGILGGGVTGATLGGLLAGKMAPGSRVANIMGLLGGGLAGGWGGGRLGGSLGDAIVGEERPGMERQRKLEDDAVEAVRSESKGREEEKAKEKESMDSLSPFARGFFENCAVAGYTNRQVKAAVDTIGDKYGKTAGDELRLAVEDMEKSAGGRTDALRYLGKLFGQGARVGRFGQAARQPLEALTKTEKAFQGAGKATGWSSKLFRAPRGRTSGLDNYLTEKGKSYGSPFKAFAGRAFGHDPSTIMRTLGHGYLGQQMGSSMGERSGVPGGSTMGGLLGALSMGRVGRAGGAFSRAGWGAKGFGGTFSPLGKAWKTNPYLNKWRNLPGAEQGQGLQGLRRAFGQDAPLAAKSVRESLGGGVMGGFTGYDVNLAANMLYGRGGPGRTGMEADMPYLPAGGALAGMLLRNPTLARRMYSMAKMKGSPGLMGRLQGAGGRLGRFGHGAQEFARQQVPGFLPYSGKGAKKLLASRGKVTDTAKGLLPVAARSQNRARQLQAAGLSLAMAPLAASGVRAIPGGDTVMNVATAGNLNPVRALERQPWTEPTTDFSDFEAVVSSVINPETGDPYNMETSGVTASGGDWSKLDPGFKAAIREMPEAVDRFNQEYAGIQINPEQGTAGKNVEYGQSLLQRYGGALAGTPAFEGLADQAMAAAAGVEPNSPEAAQARQTLQQIAQGTLGSQLFEQLNSAMKTEEGQAWMGSQLDSVIHGKTGMTLNELLAKAQGGGMEGMLDGLSEALGSIWGIFGEGMAERMAGVHPLAQIAILLGGAGLIGGMMGGSKGIATMGGLGLGMGLLGAMGGLDMNGPGPQKPPEQIPMDNPQQPPQQQPQQPQPPPPEQTSQVGAPAAWESRDNWQQQTGPQDVARRQAKANV